MAIAFDAASNTSALDMTSITTLTWSHTCSTGSDRILIVGVVSNDLTDADRVVSGVTYAGEALTLIREDQDNSRNLGRGLWYKVAPATGANNIVVTFTGTVSDGAAAAVSLTGVDQSSPIGASAADSVDNAAPYDANLTTTTDNSWVVDIGIVDQGFTEPTVQSGGIQTLRASFDGGGDYTFMGTYGPKSPAGAVQFDWEMAGGFGVEDWRGSLVEIKVAAAAATAVQDIIMSGVVPFPR